jgi:hypothetical protein
VPGPCPLPSGPSSFTLGLAKLYRYHTYALTMTQFHRILCILCVCLALVACTGIPLRSLPQLVRLQDSIVQDNPADFALAIQIDKRMIVTAQAAPALLLKLTPSRGSAVPAADLRLPLVLSLNPEPGLPPAGAGRLWLTYTLPKESQQQVLRVREAYQKANSSSSKGGITIGVGIEQEGLAVRNPALAQTDWESWLRTARERGFFELWSGTVGDLISHARH